MPRACLAAMPRAYSTANTPELRKTSRICRLLFAERSRDRSHDSARRFSTFVMVVHDVSCMHETMGLLAQAHQILRVICTRDESYMVTVPKLFVDAPITGVGTPCCAPVHQRTECIEILVRVTEARFSQCFRRSCRSWLDAEGTPAKAHATCRHPHHHEHLR